MNIKFHGTADIFRSFHLIASKTEVRPSCNFVLFAMVLFDYAFGYGVCVCVCLVLSLFGGGAINLETQRAFRSSGVTVHPAL